MEPNPILVVDDDTDDMQLIKDACSQLEIVRPVHFFKSGDELVGYLQKTSQAPFFILSDVNLPGETGFDIKKRISENKELRYISVPFIFWSTDASEQQIQQAYDLPAQGFFLKPNSFEELCKTLSTILDYWQQSQHPKRVS